MGRPARLRSPVLRDLGHGDFCEEYIEWDYPLLQWRFNVTRFRTVIIINRVSPRLKPCMLDNRLIVDLALHACC